MADATRSSELLSPRWAALSLVLALAIVVVSLYSAAPPAPVPASAEATAFSAERAARHMEALADRSRPVGSAVHAGARDYLVGELTALGLEVEVQTAWAVAGHGASALAARVHNVLARLPGTDGAAGRSAVALVSHYDSVPTGPGAGDAAACVAAILETVRAVVASGPLRNDLLVLVTDGEEAGLLGARAFVEEHPWLGDIGLVLNFEARGNAGPVTMFETTGGNGRLVRELASATPFPWASSMSYEAYRRMPNDTDLTVFRQAGVTGMNFALVGNHAAYHTRLDTPEAFDRSSLQHYGSYALGLARRFGDLDLAELSRPDDIYFNPLGFWLVVYSVSVGRLLAFLTIGGLVAILVLGRRNGVIELPGVLRGAMVGLGLPVVCALVITALWNLLVRVFPAVVAAPHGDPYGATSILVGFALICVAMSVLAAGLVEEQATLSLTAGLLVLWAALAAVLSWVAPGASYLTLWPTLSGSILLGAVLWLRKRESRDASWPLLLLPLAVALIFPPAVRLVAEALMIRAAPIHGFVLGLALAFLVPAARVLNRSRLAAPVGVAVAGLALLGWVGATARATPETPAPTSLYYALDTEKSEAWWVSDKTRVDAWTAQVLGEDASPVAPPAFLPGPADREVLAAAAEAVDLEPPVVDLVRDTFAQGARTLTVRVSSPRGAPWVTLTPDPAMATIDSLEVAGKEIAVDEAAGPVRLTLLGVPAEGVEVSIRTVGRQPMAIGALDASFGLPEMEQPLTPMPAHLLPSPATWVSGMTRVYRSAWF